MVFSSLQFIFLFIPLSMIGVFLLSEKKRNGWIFLVSIIFYTYGAIESPLYLALLLASVLVNFVLGRMMARFENTAKMILILGIIYNLFWLFVFKYSSFVLGTKSLILPIGISFYTFQSISYIVDVYRDKRLVEKSLIGFGMYITMFPQLIAGPIVRYSEIKGQMMGRRISSGTLDMGLRTFTEGLGLKVLLANEIGNCWNDINALGFESLSMPVAWVGIIAFSFQLYFDFYGYSLMAIGLGQMMGFRLPQNFDHPYEAVTMTEFWRRWHMTLGAWFREYVYIPLGGNRKGNLRAFFNLLVVWMLTGIWHGAGWNFVLWGAFLFAIIAIEKLFLKKFMDNHRLIGHLYMAFLIPISWMLFAIEDLNTIGVYISRLIGEGLIEGSFASAGINHYLSQYGVLLLICLVMCTSIPKRVFDKFRNAPFGSIVLLAIFWASIYCLFMGLNDPFLYFRF